VFTRIFFGAPKARSRASSTRYGDIRERRRMVVHSRISLALNAGYG